MDANTRRFVRQRAADRCEYCRLPQSASPLANLHVEHVIARKHGGDNLAMACSDCNLRKSSNLTGLDPNTGELTPLFHPRRHSWDDHFEERNGLMMGKTAIGRTTVVVLQMNYEDQVDLRRSCRDYAPAKVFGML